LHSLLFRYPSRLERIPNESRVDVITIKQTKLQLDMGSFITLKQFPYKVDLNTQSASNLAICPKYPPLTPLRATSVSSSSTSRASRPLMCCCGRC
jgi:hypothetical protein